MLSGTSTIELSLTNILKREARKTNQNGVGIGKKGAEMNKVETEKGKEEGRAQEINCWQSRLLQPGVA